MLVAGCYTGLGGIAAVEGLESSGGVGENLGAFAVGVCQAFRTCCSKLCSLDHSHTGPVASMSEFVQIDRWLGKDQGGMEQHSDSSAGADSGLNAAV